MDSTSDKPRPSGIEVGVNQDTISLQQDEAEFLGLILNDALRKAEVVEEGGRPASLTRKEAEPLNDVFKQLTGRDHDVYAKKFGQTMSTDEEPVKSNTIHLTDQARTAVSELLDSGLGTSNLSPAYRQYLVNLRQKMTPLRAG